MASAGVNAGSSVCGLCSSRLHPLRSGRCLLDTSLQLNHLLLNRDEVGLQALRLFSAQPQPAHRLFQRAQVPGECQQYRHQQHEREHYHARDDPPHHRMTLTPHGTHAPVQPHQPVRMRPFNHTSPYAYAR
jgi:hypothetical protein